MELEERFIKAVARREISKEIPFETEIKKGDSGSLQMFCVDGSGLAIQALGSVSFWSNITDRMSAV
jgi:hypothetical protein